MKIPLSNPWFTRPARASTAITLLALWLGTFTQTGASFFTVHRQFSRRYLCDQFIEMTRVSSWEKLHRIPGKAKGRSPQSGTLERAGHQLEDKDETSWVEALWTQNQLGRQGERSVITCIKQKGNTRLWYWNNSQSQDFTLPRYYLLFVFKKTFKTERFSKMFLAIYQTSWNDLKQQETDPLCWVLMVNNLEWPKLRDLSTLRTQRGSLVGSFKEN